MYWGCLRIYVYIACVCVCVGIFSGEAENIRVS